MSAVIEFKDVSKSYGSINALTNVSFVVEKGEFVFISGHSGSGKTTILKLLLSEVKPTAGEIYFNGTEITNLKSREIPHLRQKIGIVFQDSKLLAERTVYENVAVPLAVLNIDKKEWDERIAHVLKLVGVAGRAYVFPSQLSGGEKQRVALARALIVSPGVIFADEVTGNLDWEMADEIMDLLEQINKEGKTIIVATHHKTIIDKMKKRTIELKEGKIVSKKK